eukprot:4510951-Prymnesium_polylepis.2
MFLSAWPFVVIVCKGDNDVYRRAAKQVSLLVRSRPRPVRAAALCSCAGGSHLAFDRRKNTAGARPG